MSRWLDVKLFLWMASCTIFLIVFSNLGAYAYETVFEKTDGYAEGTQVGSISIAGLNSQEATTKVLDAIENWKVNSSITLKVQDREIQLEPSFLNFDVKGSMNAAINGQATPLLVTVDKESLLEQLKQKDEALAAVADIEKIVEEIKKSILYLNKDTYLIDITDYANGKSGQIEILSKSIVTGYDPNLESYINDWINKIGTINLESAQSYSLLSKVEGNQFSQSRLEALNVIASGLYEAALLAGFEINERHISSSLKPYIKPGFEAKIEPRLMDLSFKNTNPGNSKIKLEIVNSTLITEIEGIATDFTYELSLQNQESFVPKRILQYSPLLEGNETKVVTEGKEGLQVYVYRNEYDKTNQLVESELISKDFYPPIHTVIQVAIPGGNTVNDTVINEGIDAEKQTDIPDAAADNKEAPKEEKAIWGSPNEVQKGD